VRETADMTCQPKYSYLFMTIAHARFRIIDERIQALISWRPIAGTA